MPRLALLALACLVAAGRAFGAHCGDDVDGHGTAVPCACGDTLVSSRTLGSGDPITQAPCPGTGLVVAVPADHPGAVLNLAGETITGGGTGTGIVVSRGGQGGLTLVGPGSVRGFGLGVDAAGEALAVASEVGSYDNRTDGFLVAGAGWTIHGCEASSNGRDGFSLRGARFNVEGNRAYGNGRYGFRISGVVGASTNNEAAANGRDGIVVGGRDLDVNGPTATANGGAGVRVRLVRGKVSGGVSAGNAGDGVRVRGLALDLGDVRTDANGGVGLRRTGGCRGKECR